MWITVYLLIIFCSLAFIPHNVPDMFWIPKEMVYTLFGFSVIGASWIGNGNKRIVYRNLWGGILLIYTIVGFCWHFYGILLFPPKGAVIFNLWNFRPTLNIILGLLLMQTLVENTITFRNWIDISKILCWLCGIFSCFALLQWSGIDQVFGASTLNFINGHENNMQKMVTFMSNKFLTACFLAMTAPLCLMFSNYKYKVIYGLSFLAICLTDTTTPLIAFIVSTLVYLIFFRKWKLIALSVLLVGGLIYYLASIRYDFFLGTGRIPLWREVLLTVKETNMGFLGNGMGSFPGNFKIYKANALSAHNEYIQMFWEGGLALLVIFAGYMINLVRRSYYYLKSNYSTLFICYTCGLISCLLISVNGFPFRIAPLALIMILYISSLEAQIQGRELV